MLPKKGRCADLIGQRQDTDWAMLTRGQGQRMEGDGVGPALSFHPSEPRTWDYQVGARTVMGATQGALEAQGERQSNGSWN